MFGLVNVDGTEDPPSWLSVLSKPGKNSACEVTGGLQRNAAVLGLFLSFLPCPLQSSFYSPGKSGKPKAPQQVKYAAFQWDPWLLLLSWCPSIFGKAPLASDGSFVLGQPEQHHHDVFSFTSPASPDPSADASATSALSPARAANFPAQLQCQVSLDVGVSRLQVVSSFLFRVNNSCFIPRPQWEILSSSFSSGPAPSPSSFLPSPSPQPSQSPAAARTPQNFSVPSPGPLNTPGNLCRA